MNNDLEIVDVEQSAKKIKLFDKKFIIFTSVVLFITALVVIFNTVIAFTVVVSGSSMKPTFVGGEVLYVSKISELERGDIIIVNIEQEDNSSEELWIIKRLIGMPGDTVGITDGYVYLNGQLLEEEYVSAQGVTEAMDWVERTLGEDEYFYLGDNRGVMQSSDSRTANKGACSREDILGVVTETCIKMQGVSSFMYKITTPIRRIGQIIRGN